jgi:SAM-dependent methyltransferase
LIDLTNSAPRDAAPHQTPLSAASAPAAAETAISARERQRLDWERVAGSVSDFYGAPSTQYYRRCEIALLQRSFGPLRGKRLLKLDLWNEAFNTRILHWASSQGAEVFGLDLSQVVATHARRNGREAGGASPGDLRVLRADIREIPFADDTFDLIYTMGTIEHIDEYAQAVAEIRRVLRPGGRAIIGVPHRWNLFLRPLMVALLTACGRYLYAPEKSFGGGELRRLIESQGLRVTWRSGLLAAPGFLRMADLYLFTRANPLWRLSRLWVPLFELAETRWRWPGRFGYLMAMLAEKPPASDPAAE